jgi:LPXTG-motif cell wall-anchored protein
VLTDSYAAQSFPVADLYSGVLDEGFLDQYDAGEIALYYVTHPLDLVSLFDVGAHSAFITRSDFSGNYERSVGLPPRAKTPFMSIWSTFKEQSAPKTAGLFLLLGAALIFFRRKKADDTPEGEAELTFTMLCLLLIVFAIAQMLTVVVMSGDSLLVRQSFLMSVFIDILVVLFLSEVLHKLRIIDVDKE